MATHSSILAWRIPGTEEPSGLPSMGSHRVEHDWSDLATAATAWIVASSFGARLSRGSDPSFLLQVELLSEQTLFLWWLICLWLVGHSFQGKTTLGADLYLQPSHVLVAQSCQTLCDPMDDSPSGSSVHGILQARILEWVALPFSKGSSQPRDWTQVSCIAGGFFTVWATRHSSLAMPSLRLIFWSPIPVPLAICIGSAYTWKSKER